jgi:F0F1-type ATP synthase membrane subunit b/b'
VAEVRAEVADLALAAAARVVGETMNEQRERRLVEEFLGQMNSGTRQGSSRN